MRFASDLARNVCDPAALFCIALCFGSPHSLPAWLGELTAKTFEACGKQRGLESEKMSYTTRSHPLPLTATEVPLNLLLVLKH